MATQRYTKLFFSKNTNCVQAILNAPGINTRELVAITNNGGLSAPDIAIYANQKDIFELLNPYMAQTQDELESVSDSDSDSESE